MSKIKSISIPIIMLFCITGCIKNQNKYPNNNNLKDVAREVWKDTDNARDILLSIPYDNLDGKDKYYWLFYDKITKGKNMYDINNDSLKYFRGIFEEYNDDYHVGITYYLEGLQYKKQHLPYSEVLEKMKQAEYYIIKCEPTPYFLLGRIYDKISYALYLDHMYEQSIIYTNKTIECLQLGENDTNEDANNIILASAYEGLMQIDTNINQRKIYYENALNYARKLKDSLISYDIQIIYSITQEPLDTLTYIKLAKLSCNTTRTTHWAHSVADYYIQHHEWDSAQLYLDKFALDTSRIDWSKRTYKSLLANYLYERNNITKAYDVLSDLYADMIKRGESMGYARSYAIARQYDDIMDREEKIRQQEKTNQLKMTLGISTIFLLLLLLIITFLILQYRRRKAEHLLEIEHQEAEKRQLEAEHTLQLKEKELAEAQLQAEVDALQAILREKLRQRLEITKRFQLDRFKGRTTDELPEWVRQLIQITTFTDNQQWLLFRDEYNNATHGKLDNLKLQYPTLTEADLQYIAFSSLGLTVEEICILLGTTNRTIWNRKQTVKKKMGQTD